MPKPIVVMYIPEYFELGNGNRDAANELMTIFNGWDNDKYKTSDYWSDYYWLVFKKHGIDAPELEVFYEKDFTEIKFQELKELVLQNIQEIKSK
jgi:hypothetical protein